MRKPSLISTVALALFGAASVCAAETLEEAQKKIAEALGKHKTMQVKTKFTQDFKSEAFRMKSSGESQTEYRKKSDKVYQSRVETRMKGVREMGGKEEKDDSTILQIVDGEFSYVLTETAGQKTAMKQKLNPKTDVNPFDAAALFKLQEKDFAMKLLPDETIGGKAAYVIEATPKKAQEGQPFSRMVNWYDKKTGIALKSVSYDKAGKEVMTSVATDVKLDGDIPDARFVFKAPAGVEVIDMTKMTEAAEEAENEGAKKEESSAKSKDAEEPGAEAKEEPKKEEPKKEEKKGLGGLLDKIKK